MARVQAYTDSSLGDLGISRGDLVAFYNDNKELSAPFVITRANVLARDHSDMGLKLSFMTRKGLEKWTLIPLGGVEKGVIHLFPPSNQERPYTVPRVSTSRDRTNKFLVPNFRRGHYFNSSPYPVGFAYLGRREIANALCQPNVFDLGVYANWIDTGDFVVERGILGRTGESIGLEDLLPAVPRFRKGTCFLVSKGI